MAAVNATAGGLKKEDKNTPRNIITKRRVKKTKAMPIREGLEPLVDLSPLP